MNLAEKSSIMERREARRKRILDNMESRLNKIASFESSNGDSELPVRSAPAVERETINHYHENKISSYEEAVDPVLPELPGAWSPISTTSGGEAKVEVSSPFPIFLFSRQLHIILLSFLVHALLLSDSAAMFFEVCYVST